jgi:carbon-monoxide dehydrogenase small subunit
MSRLRETKAMKLEGAQEIAADRETVWAALNDPEVLKASIPGCQSLEMVSDTELHAKVKQKIGPVSATFDGVVTLSDVNPPESYRIAGEGKGGAAGFAKGGADVALEEIEGGTRLTYHVDAKVGGKLAQLGGRLIDGVAHKLANQFFANFKAEVEGPGAADEAAPTRRRSRRPPLRRRPPRRRRPRMAPWRPPTPHPRTPRKRASGSACSAETTPPSSKSGADGAQPTLHGEESMPTVSMTVNGKSVSGDVEGRTLLVDFLRSSLSLTGTHVGCDTSQCGACVVHMNGESVKACSVFAAAAEGAEIRTIEGMANADGTLGVVQQAFQDNHGLQCGFCTPGMVMSAADLLSKNPDPSEQEVREWLEGNICRCTGYHNIVKAILAAGATLRGEAVAAE